jgi:hypothetical protein
MKRPKRDPVRENRFDSGTQDWTLPRMCYFPVNTPPTVDDPVPLHPYAP